MGNPIPMVNIRAKTPGKTKAAFSKQALKPANKNSSSGIKKAINTTKPSESDEANSTNEELDTETSDENVDPSSREETDLEKKKNLDRLLKRGLTNKDSKTKKESNKKTEPELDKETNKEWQDKTNAKDKDGKRTEILTDKDKLKDVLKYDKDSIAKRYPGIERARPGSSSNGSTESSKTQGNSGGSNNNYNSGTNGSNGGGNNNSGGSGSNNNSSSVNNGISRLSDNRARSYDNSSSYRPYRGDRNFINNLGSRQDSKVIDRGRNNIVGSKQKVAHTKFESLFTDGHVEGKILHAKTSADAQRIASTLEDIGAFNKIEQNGNSIKLSGFNADTSHDIHEAHGKVLGREFMEGNINKLSFEGVNENAAGNLTQMLESKADEIGSENHSINSDCNNGTCQVTVENNQNQEIQNNQGNNEEQYA